MLACAVQGAALLVWGDPELLHDEADYVSQAKLVAAWLSGEGGASTMEALGRLALHNPGYSFLVAVAEATTQEAALTLRLLQAAAGVITGLVLYGALAGRVGTTLALVAAWVVWAHPTLIFFRLTLWPVTFAALGVSLAAAEGLRLYGRADSKPPRWTLPLTLAVLPFFSASGWLLLPLVFLLFERQQAMRACAPAIVLWCLWTCVLSIGLGTPTATDLSASRNLALANHPAISEGRGSLWGDPTQKAVYLSELEARCTSSNLRTKKRCEHAYNLDVASGHIAKEPWEAVVRAGHRLTETWEPDRFLVRHLDARGGFTFSSSQLPKLIAALHWSLLFLSLLGLRTPQGRAALLAVLLWTMPVLLTVGFTRLRQPVLALLLIAAAFGIHSLRRTYRDGS